jgi:hypothetical protein
MVFFRSTRENYDDAAVEYAEPERETSKCVVKDEYVQNSEINIKLKHNINHCRI